MPTSDDPLADLCLLLKPGTYWDQYILEVHVGTPAKAAPLASAEIGLPNRLWERVEALEKGGGKALENLGDCVADWLFAADPTSGQPPHPGSGRRLNAVGEFLDARLRAIPGAAPPSARLFLAPDIMTTMEFGSGKMLFESLRYSTFMPVHVARGLADLAGQGSAKPSPAAGVEAVSDKLVVLLVYANPVSGHRFPHLPDLEAKFEALIETLNPLVHSHGIFIVTLKNPTPEELKNQIAMANPHALVFAGHGYYGSDEEGLGGMVCVREGAPAFLPYAELAEVLEGIAKRTGEVPALRLGVFVACQSFLAAPHLLWAQVPAVVAMQPLKQNGEFPYAGMQAFAAAFFSRLAQLGSIGEAYRESCEALQKSVMPAAAVMPTLWLSGTKDRLFAPLEQRLKQLYLNTLLGKVGSLAPMTLPGDKVVGRFEDLYIDQVVKGEPEKEQDPTGDRDTEESSKRAQRAGVESKDVSGGRDEEVDLWAELKTRHWVLVEAPAWTGKTMLSRQMMQTCIGHGWLPIFVPFRSLTQSKNRESLQKYLEEDYTNSLELGNHQFGETLRDGKLVPANLGAWLCGQLKGGQALLIVDGLDEEYDTTWRKKGIEALPAFHQENALPHVLFTSRPLVGQSVPGVKRYLDLKVLELPQIEDLVTRYGRLLDAPQKAEDFLREVQENHAARELAERPGHLVHMFRAYEQDGKLLSAEEQILKWVADKRFTNIDSRIAERDEKGRDVPKLREDFDKPEFKQQVVEEVAFHFLLCRQAKQQDSGGMKGLVKWATLHVAEAQPGKCEYTNNDGELMFDDLLRTSGFIVQPKEGYYEFESVPWLHFFAASFLVRKLQKDPRFKLWILGKAPRSRMEALWFALRRRVSQTPEPGLPCEVCNTALPSFPHYLWRRKWHDVILMMSGIMEDATPLVERIERESEDKLKKMLMLRSQVVGRARRTGKNAAERLHSELYRMFSGKDEFECRQAVEAFGLSMDKKAVPVLINVIEKRRTEYWLLRAAMRILGALKDERAVLPLVNVVKREEQEWELGEDVMRALGTLGGGSFALALEEVVRERGQRYWWRVNLVRALGKLGARSVVPTLIDMVNDEGEWELVREAARDVLGTLTRDRSTVLPMVVMNRSALQTLIDVVNNQREESVARCEAALALGALRDRRAFQTLVDVVERREYDYLCICAVEALGMLDDPRAVPFLSEIVRNKTGWHDKRLEALKALDALEDRRAVPSLVEVAEDKEEFFRDSGAMRWGSVRVLGKLGDKTVLPILAKLLDRENREYRRRPLSAVHEYEGRLLIYDRSESYDVDCYSTWRIAVDAICEREEVRVLPGGKVEPLP